MGSGESGKESHDEDRLKLDDGLMRKRAGFERYKEQLRRTLIVRYQVKPPKSERLIHTP
jgi:hypothetical protein